MTVVSVNRDKKHCMRVELDDGRVLFIDLNVCPEYGLIAGKTVDEEQLTKILYRSDYTRARERALWYLDRSDHTEKALYTKIVKAGFSPRACAAVIARLRECGLLDDRRFAERYAEQCANANVSPRESYFKLLNKGIPKELAREILDAADTDETVQIRALLEKKYRNKLTDRAATQRVYAALIRKGFSFGAVRDVMKQYVEELEYMSEE